MVGSALATMVWLSAARNISSMRPSTMVRISPWLRTQRPGCGPDGGEMGLSSSGIEASIPLLVPAVTPTSLWVNPERPATILADAAAPYRAFQIAARTADDYADAHVRA